MYHVPEHITGVCHPLISDLYVKTDFHHKDKPQDVLVINTKTKKEFEQEKFDDYLLDLLGDLDALRSQAESKIGKFDRIDIRTH